MYTYTVRRDNLLITLADTQVKSQTVRQANRQKYYTNGAYIRIRIGIRIYTHTHNIFYWCSLLAPSRVQNLPSSFQFTPSLKQFFFPLPSSTVPSLTQSILLALVLLFLATQQQFDHLLVLHILTADPCRDFSA